jgi:hypothetical protein
MRLLPAVVASGVASYQVFFRHHYIAGGILYGIAALLLIAALFVPPLHAAITRFFRWFGRGVGVGVTWLLLVPFYFLFFTTARVFLTLTGKDPLTRRWEKSAASYWVDRKPVTDVRHFQRQS